MNLVPQMEMQKSPVLCVAHAGSCRRELFLFGHLGSSPGLFYIAGKIVTPRGTELLFSRNNQELTSYQISGLNNKADQYGSIFMKTIHNNSGLIEVDEQNTEDST
ncbi:uncharacterized protein LOC130540817 [Pan paniscus]|uniref:uncharacterized protein LOC130540817 n=1 Tax=Pan paniscus TaxID=9597 RepID=UPI000D4FFCF4|nr:uncharacterized protein LOC130540817 [Pan paniscus]